MASSQVGSVPAKLSFAKVAAMRAPAAPASHPNPNIIEDKKTRIIENNHVTNNSRKPPPANQRMPSASPRKANEPVFGRMDVQAQSDYVTTAIEGLSLVKDAATAAGDHHGGESGESLEDDQSHLSNSSTKLQSFDTKSMASVTTFAMDEKESIRPDDSASVRAVDDDESLIPPSRELSFHRDSEHHATTSRQGLRPSTSGVTIAPRRYHTLTSTNTPRFGDLPISPIVQPGSEDDPVAEHQADVANDVHERATPLPVAPDEKLLDALATPKDRLPLLQLEEKLLAFIANPRSEFLDLPPQNAFARLLAHKLADYYMLAHHINEDGTSIRLFKTPLITMRPTPLYMLASSIPVGPAQPPAAMTIKVLRRAGLDARQQSIGGSTAASSSAPSKATSDAGQETNSEEGIASPSDSTPSKDKSKLTREEREAQYKAARERIFGDFQEPAPSESASTGDHSASMSRSSSSSGKRKTRKVKTPKDDSFEARSAFIPSYTPMNMPSIHQHYQPQYSEQTYQGSYPSSDPYGLSMNYGTTPTQSFSGYDQSMSFNGNNRCTAPYGNNNHFGPRESWDPAQSPASTNYFNYSQPLNNYQQSISPMAAQVNSQYIQQPHLGLQQNQPWLNNQYQNPYPPQPVPGNTDPASWSAYQANSAMNNSQPYAYGHLPGQNYGGNPPYNPQHPVPGSYSRSLFNPQTRSFVPNNASSRNGGRNGRKKPSPSSSQNRANSASKPFGPDASLPNTLPPGSRSFDKGSSHSSSPQPKEDSLQQRYGAPAHLPKKPPPSQVFPSFDMENIMNNTGAPVSNSAIVNGGVAGAGSSNATGAPSA